MAQKLPSLFGESSPDKSMFRSLHDEIDRVFDAFRGQTTESAQSFLTSLDGKIMPRIDVSEADGIVEITAELPGIEEKNLDVSVTDNVITLKGEKSSDREEKKKDYHLVERRFGSFLRRIPLDFPIDADKVKTEFKDGILTMTVEKPKEIAAKTRKIKITKS